MNFFASSSFLKPVSFYIFLLSNILGKSKEYLIIHGEQEINEKITNLFFQKIELLKKVQTLDEDTRNVIYLRTFGNLNYEEIAEIMNKTPSWARVTYFRGKQKLREMKD